MILKKAWKNKIYLVPAIMFCAWLVFLIITGSFASHQTTFFDALGQKDVTSEYAVEVPALRYVFEPFVGFTLAIAINSTDALLVFTLVYLAIRVVFLGIEKVTRRGNKKIGILAAYARNFMNFYWKYCILTFLIGILVLLVGYSAQGELFFHYHFMAVVQMSIVSWLVLLVLKLARNVITLCKPTAQLRVKKPKPWTTLSRKSGRYWNHKTWDVIGRETRYGLSIFLFFAMFCMNMISTQVPTQLLRPKLADGEILIDLHVHTTMSDGWLSPEERVDWYISQGIHVAAFSDHQNTRGALRAREYVKAFNLDFTVIVAQEFTSYVPDIHLNVYGLEECLSPIEFQGQPFSPNCMNVSDMIAYVKAHGGYVTVNHYEPPGSGPYTYQQLLDWGVDGFEIVNGGDEKAAQIRQFCLDHNHTLACLAGSDEHSNGPLNSFMEVKLADPAN
ncbi:MAG: PHP domain-containing protein, partial [Candidatus Sigynarchaeota archaeon]